MDDSIYFADDFFGGGGLKRQRHGHHVETPPPRWFFNADGEAMVSTDRAKSDADRAAAAKAPPPAPPPPPSTWAQLMAYLSGKKPTPTTPQQQPSASTLQIPAPPISDQEAAEWKSNELAIEKMRQKLDISLDAPISATEFKAWIDIFVKAESECAKSRDQGEIDTLVNEAKQKLDDMSRKLKQVQDDYTKQFEDGKFTEMQTEALNFDKLHSTSYAEKVGVVIKMRTGNDNFFANCQRTLTEKFHAVVKTAEARKHEILREGIPPAVQTQWNIDLENAKLMKEILLTNCDTGKKLVQGIIARLNSASAECETARSLESIRTEVSQALEHQRESWMKIDSLGQALTTQFTSMKFADMNTDAAAFDQKHGTQYQGEVQFVIDEYNTTKRAFDQWQVDVDAASEALSKAANQRMAVIVGQGILNSFVSDNKKAIDELSRDTIDGDTLERFVKEVTDRRDAALQQLENLHGVHADMGEIKKGVNDDHKVTVQRATESTKRLVEAKTQQEEGAVVQGPNSDDGKTGDLCEPDSEVRKRNLTTVIEQMMQHLESMNTSVELMLQATETRDEALQQLSATGHDVALVEPFKQVAGKSRDSALGQLETLKSAYVKEFVDLGFEGEGDAMLKDAQICDRDNGTKFEAKVKPVIDKFTTTMKHMDTVKSKLQEEHTTRIKCIEYWFNHLQTVREVTKALNEAVSAAKILVEGTVDNALLLGKLATLQESCVTSYERGDFQAMLQEAIVCDKKRKTTFTEAVNGVVSLFSATKTQFEQWKNQTERELEKVEEEAANLVRCGQEAETWINHFRTIDDVLRALNGHEAKAQTFVAAFTQPRYDDVDDLGTITTSMTRVQREQDAVLDQLTILQAAINSKYKSGDFEAMLKEAIVCDQKNLTDIQERVKSVTKRHGHVNAAIEEHKRVVTKASKAAVQTLKEREKELMAKETRKKEEAEQRKQEDEARQKLLTDVTALLNEVSEKLASVSHEKPEAIREPFQAIVNDLEDKEGMTQAKLTECKHKFENVAKVNVTIYDNYVRFRAGYLNGCKSVAEQVSGAELFKGVQQSLTSHEFWHEYVIHEKLKKENIIISVPDEKKARESLALVMTQHVKKFIDANQPLQSHLGTFETQCKILRRDAKSEPLRQLLVSDTEPCLQAMSAALLAKMQPEFDAAVEGALSEPEFWTKSTKDKVHLAEAMDALLGVPRWIDDQVTRTVQELDKLAEVATSADFISTKLDTDNKNASFWQTAMDDLVRQKAPGGPKAPPKDAERNARINRVKEQWRVKVLDKTEGKYQEALSRIHTNQQIETGKKALTDFTNSRDFWSFASELAKLMVKSPNDGKEEAIEQLIKRVDDRVKTLLKQQQLKDDQIQALLETLHTQLWNSSTSQIQTESLLDSGAFDHLADDTTLQEGVKMTVVREIMSTGFFNWKADGEAVKQVVGSFISEKLVAILTTTPSPSMTRTPSAEVDEDFMKLVKVRFNETNLKTKWFKLAQSVIDAVGKFNSSFKDLQRKQTEFETSVATFKRSAQQQTKKRVQHEHAQVKKELDGKMEALKSSCENLTKEIEELTPSTRLPQDLQSKFLASKSELKTSITNKLGEATDAHKKKLEEIAGWYTQHLEHQLEDAITQITTKFHSEANTSLIQSLFVRKGWGKDARTEFEGERTAITAIYNKAKDAIEQAVKDAVSKVPEGQDTQAITQLKESRLQPIESALRGIQSTFESVKNVMDEAQRKENAAKVLVDKIPDTVAGFPDETVLSQRDASIKEAKDAIAEIPDKTGYGNELSRKLLSQVDTKKATFDIAQAIEVATQHIQHISTVVDVTSLANIQHSSEVEKPLLRLRQEALELIGKIPGNDDETRSTKEGLSAAANARVDALLTATLNALVAAANAEIMAVPDSFEGSEFDNPEHSTETIKEYFGRLQMLVSRIPHGTATDESIDRLQRALNARVGNFEKSFSTVIGARLDQQEKLLGARAMVSNIPENISDWIQSSYSPKDVQTYLISLEQNANNAIAAIPQQQQGVITTIGEDDVIMALTNTKNAKIAALWGQSAAHFIAAARARVDAVIANQKNNKDRQQFTTTDDYDGGVIGIQRQLQQEKDLINGLYTNCEQNVLRITTKAAPPPPELLLLVEQVRKHNTHIDYHIQRLGACNQLYAELKANNDLEATTSANTAQAFADVCNRVLAKISIKEVRGADLTSEHLHAEAGRLAKMARVPRAQPFHLLHGLAAFAQICVYVRGEDQAPNTDMRQDPIIKALVENKVGNLDIHDPAYHMVETTDTQGLVVVAGIVADESYFPRTSIFDQLVYDDGGVAMEDEGSGAAHSSGFIAMATLRFLQNLQIRLDAQVLQFMQSEDCVYDALSRHVQELRSLMIDQLMPFLQGFVHIPKSDSLEVLKGYIFNSGGTQSLQQYLVGLGARKADEIRQQLALTHIHLLALQNIRHHMKIIPMYQASKDAKTRSGRKIKERLAFFVEVQFPATTAEQTLAWALQLILTRHADYELLDKNHPGWFAINKMRNVIAEGFPLPTSDLESMLPDVWLALESAYHDDVYNHLRHWGWVDMWIDAKFANEKVVVTAPLQQMVMFRGSDLLMKTVFDGLKALVDYVSEMLFLMLTTTNTTSTRNMDHAEWCRSALHIMRQCVVNKWLDNVISHFPKNEDFFRHLRDDEFVCLLLVEQACDRDARRKSQDLEAHKGDATQLKQMQTETLQEVQRLKDDSNWMEKRTNHLIHMFGCAKHVASMRTKLLAKAEAQLRAINFSLEEITKNAMEEQQRQQLAAVETGFPKGKEGGTESYISGLLRGVSAAVNPFATRRRERDVTNEEEQAPPGKKRRTQEEAETLQDIQTPQMIHPQEIAQTSHEIPTQMTTIP